MMLLLMQWPFKYVYKCTDSVFDGSATLNSRRTSIQTVQTIWIFFRLEIELYGNARGQQRT